MRQQLASAFVLFLLSKRVVNDVSKFVVELLPGNVDHSRVLRIPAPLRPEWLGIAEASEQQQHNNKQTASDRRFMVPRGYLSEEAEGVVFYLISGTRTERIQAPVVAQSEI